MKCEALLFRQSYAMLCEHPQQKTFLHEELPLQAARQ